MKLSDCRDAYYEASGKTSDIVRQLGFAGIAVIWVFKNQQEGTEILPRLLLSAGALIVIGLTLDLFQYVVKTLIWGFYNRNKEKQRSVNENTEFKAPWIINWPPIIFFWSKIIIMVWAYSYLIRFLIQRFLSSN